MEKIFIILSTLFLVGCGHMPSTEVESTENDQYSHKEPTSEDQKNEYTEPTTK